MRRLAAVTAAAVLGSGCIVTDSSSPGSINLYWDFVRNAPAQAGGTIIYDDLLTGSGTGSCVESGVEVVVFDTSAGQGSVPCLYAGVQGVTIDGLNAGNQTVTVHAWKKVGGVDTLVFESSVQVNVPSGGVRDVYVDTAAVTADIDVVAYFDHQTGGTVDLTYATCSDASFPSTDWTIWDSAGTVIDYGTVNCTTGSALGLPILISTLDVEDYTTRLQGYTTGFTDPVFDSCPSSSAKYLSIAHAAPEIGASAWQIDLFTPPFCAPTP